MNEQIYYLEDTRDGLMQVTKSTAMEFLEMLVQSDEGYIEDLTDDENWEEGDARFEFKIKRHGETMYADDFDKMFTKITNAIHESNPESLPVYQFEKEHLVEWINVEYLDSPERLPIARDALEQLGKL